MPTLIACLLAVIVLVFVIAVAMRLAELRVTRNATIAAPAPTVFGLVNDFRKWEAWSPWAKRDPNMKQIYEGPPSGVGAICSWVGNKEVGEGRMTLTESRPDEIVRIRLEFFKPFKATNTTEFTFAPEGDQTRVTWTMDGKNNFVAKAIGLVMDMDKMIGCDFEAGLAAMRSIAESTKA